MTRPIIPDGDMLPGTLVHCTYEGLPLKFPEWDDLYIAGDIIGDIPTGIWDEIRDKHEAFMKDNPGDWMVDDLANITIMTFIDHGLQVYHFHNSCEFPALRNLSCDYCRNIIPKGDKIVRSEATGDAVFCTESCLFEALTSKGSGDGEVKVTRNLDEDASEEMLTCPHCLKHSWSVTDKWGSEGIFVVPGPKGFKFSIMTCPLCGGIAPLVEE